MYNKKIKRTEQKRHNFCYRKNCAPFVRRLFWRYVSVIGAKLGGVMNSIKWIFGGVGATIIGVVLSNYMTNSNSTTQSDRVDRVTKVNYRNNSGVLINGNNSGTITQEIKK